MKRTLLGLAVIGLSCNALADDLYPTGFYIGGKVGTAIVHPEKIEHKDAKPGSYSKGVFSSSLVGGYDFFYDYNMPIRTELDFTMRSDAKKDIEKDTKIKVATHANTLLANVYYDFYTGTAFTPYLNTGAGLTFNKLKIGPDGSEESKKKTKFAWTVGLGSSYKFTHALSADLSVRFVDAGKTKDDDNKISAKTVSTDILIGIRYAF